MHGRDTRLSSNCSDVRTSDCILFWLRGMQVGTAMNHPHKGKTQLFRRNVNTVQLREIFRVSVHHHKLPHTARMCLFVCMCVLDGSCTRVVLRR